MASARLGSRDAGEASQHQEGRGSDKRRNWLKSGAADGGVGAPTVKEFLQLRKQLETGQC